MKLEEKADDGTQGLIRGEGGGCCVRGEGRCGGEEREVVKERDWEVRCWYSKKSLMMLMRRRVMLGYRGRR